ncbi:eukaryotic translation initiation factor 3subunit M [Striga asiatica]|uniref:Eukaryotic translation initiation factor 3subunit M n=1 Tax=Striga asiatica TaxID=4170 RepID=A0A5A7RBV0_STRAF|nr:eukaryotic translation initiation factor 3subunit M [Striga asiatica]
MEIAPPTPLEREKISSPPATSTAAPGESQPPIPRPSAPRSHHEPAGPYPTTIVQADATIFEQVVQMLTRPSDNAKQAATLPAAPSATWGGMQEMYERRNSLKNRLMINTLLPAGFLARQPGTLSPSILDFPSLALSPATPLNAKEEAFQAVIELVKSSDMFQVDLLDIPIVVQLEKDAEYVPIYQLLKVFLTKRSNAYLDFCSSNYSIFANYGMTSFCLIFL